MNSSRITLYKVKAKQRFKGIRSNKALPTTLPNKVNFSAHLSTFIELESIVNATSSVSHFLNNPNSFDSKCCINVDIHSLSIPPASVDSSPIKAIFHSYVVV